jgi:hypothetical protein
MKNNQEKIFATVSNGDGLHHISSVKVLTLFNDRESAEWDLKNNNPTVKKVVEISLEKLKQRAIKNNESVFYVNGMGWIHT